MPLDQYDAMFGDPLARPKRVSPFTTEQETGLLGNLLEGSLGGLSYLGKLADKTFGARGVRGLLGGNPRELLSVLPLSDTLGLTNEADTVHGTDLNAALGLTTAGDTSTENEIAGFGTELLTDPSMWVGAAVPRAVLGGLGRGGNYAARQAGSLAGLASGGRINPYTFAQDKARRAGRVANTLFDTSVAETTGEFGQNLARTEYTPRLAAGRQAAEDSFASALSDLDPYAKRVVGNQDQYLDFNRALFGNAELPADPGHAARLAGLGFAPNEVTDILARGSRVAADTRATRQAEQGVGALSKDFRDIAPWQAEANAAAANAGATAPFAAQPTEYFPRTAAEWDLPGEFGRRQRDRLTGVSEFQKARREEFLGLPGGTLGIDALARDPALSGAGRTSTDLQVEDHALRLLTGHGSGPVPPAWQGTPWGDAAWAGARAQAKDLSDFLKGLPPQAQEHGLFNMDFLGNARARQMESARVVASANTIQAGLHPSQGVVGPVAGFQAAGQRAVPVPEILARTGLTHVDPVTNSPVAAENIARAFGVAVSDLKTLAVPADVAADMLRMGQAWKVPESVAPVVDFWDRITSLFKGDLTSPFPAFHVRNLMSGMFNMWRDNALSWTAGTDMLRVLRGGSLSDATAGRLFPGMAAGEATRRFREMLIANNVSFTRAGQTGERVGATAAVTRGGLMPGMLPEVGAAAPRPAAGDVGQFLGGYVPERGKVAAQLNPLNARGVAGEESTFIPVKQGERLGNTAEDWIRGTHFLGSMLNGHAPADAKLAVMKYQFDYGDLTQFEKNVMKRAFPWYTFSRKNLPPLLEDLAARPAKLTGALRATTGVRERGEFVPPYVAEGAAVPIPGAEDGQRRYISSFGLPFEDELVKTLGAAAQGDPRRVFQQLFGMAQPLAKLPAEVATGTQMYSGRRLEDLQPYEFSSLGGLLPEDAARRASQVIANTPASRLGSTVDKLIDTRKGVVPTLANTLSGVRVTDVDTEKVKDVIARDTLQQLLRGEPGVKVREEVYVPKAGMEKLSPQDLQVYDLLQEVQRRQMERARLVKSRQKETAAQAPVPR